MVYLFTVLPIDDVVGGCDVDDVDTVLVTAFVVVDTVCFVEPVDTIDEEGNVTGKDCVDWIRDTGGDDDDGCSTDDDCGSDGDGGDGVSCFDWFDANDDIDCDSCSDDDDPDATSVGDSDADGDSGGSVDDGASCVDCDCDKSDFDDGDGVGDGDGDLVTGKMYLENLSCSSEHLHLTANVDLSAMLLKKSHHRNQVSRLTFSCSFFKMCGSTITAWDNFSKK